MTDPQDIPRDAVDLYWLPLGAGDANRAVRVSGRIFEAVVARRAHRPSCDLYHSALQVRLGGVRYVVEMAPVWASHEPDRGVACEGPVFWPWLGCSRLFRYEVRRWRDGVIPDLPEAVDSPQRLSVDPGQAGRVLALVPAVPRVAWGRDDLATGDMWNSNSVVSWLLACSGHDLSDVEPPAGGRAPGWAAGMIEAARQVSGLGPRPVRTTRRARATHRRP